MNISISKKNDLMICARNSQIICKIKPKSWLQILGHSSVATKCETKLLQTMASITKCGRK